MRGRFLCVLFLVLLVSPALSYTYGVKVNPSAKKSADESEYASLLAKFPDHKNIIDTLYADYSGWVIEFSERFGMLPLLAVCGHDDAEGVLPLLRRYAEIFTEIFDALEALRLSEVSRSKTALDILTAFTVWDSEDKAEYYSTVKSAALKDSETAFTGSRANYYARKIPDSSKIPANFLHDLKAENPDGYKKFLHEISQADYDTLKAICTYPNALAFLLNTGREGARLIDATGGQIIVLPWFVPDDVQKGMPEIFRKYPKLSEALKVCGADVFFTVMLCPELFFTLAESLDGTSCERFMTAYAVILSQADSGGDAVNFLKGLTPKDCRKIARYAAEIMNLPDDDMSLAPVNEELFMSFVLSYGDNVADMCKRFSSLVDVSRLFMQNWRRDVQDVSPVIDAVDDFGLMGLQAAIHFRYAEDTQKFILSYPGVSQQRRDLLMFMLYDDVTGHIYTENIAARSDGAKYMLEHYTIDRTTGEPVQIKKTVTERAVKYIPGMDIIAPAYNYVRYGKTPTLMECFQGAMDLYNLIPIASGTAAIVKGIAAGNSKRVLTAYAKSAVEETAAESLKAAGQETLKIFADKAGLTLGRMKSEASRIFRALGTRSAVVIAETKMPSWENSRDFIEYMSGKASTLGISFMKMYMQKSSRDFLVSETSGSIQEAAMKRNIHVMGVNSALNHFVRK